MANNEQLFRKKAAEGYLVCFNNDCPLHEQCLRCDIGQYAPSGNMIISVVNPHHAHATDGKCTLFTLNQKVKMPVGMKLHFYEDMPARIAKRIKQRLIDRNCRSTYYQYHNGTRPIPSAMLSFIEQVCREEGWQAPLVFDGEVEDYVW